MREIQAAMVRETGRKAAEALATPAANGDIGDGEVEGEAGAYTRPLQLNLSHFGQRAILCPVCEEL
jgi:hypothetical protein